MEGNLKEIAICLEGNFAEKKEIGRKPCVPKVEALEMSKRHLHFDICKIVRQISC